MQYSAECGPGRVDSDHKIGALDAGGDHDVTKPFNVGGLLARVWRRHAAVVFPAGPSTLGSSPLDPEAGIVTGMGTRPSVHLTRIEWQLLDVFA